MVFQTSSLHLSRARNVMDSSEACSVFACKCGRDGFREDRQHRGAAHSAQSWPQGAANLQTLMEREKRNSKWKYPSTWRMKNGKMFRLCNPKGEMEFLFLQAYWWLSQIQSYALETARDLGYAPACTYFGSLLLAELNPCFAQGSLFKKWVWTAVTLGDGKPGSTPTLQMEAEGHCLISIGSQTSGHPKVLNAGTQGHQKRPCCNGDCLWACFNTSQCSLRFPGSRKEHQTE